MMNLTNTLVALASSSSITPQNTYILVKLTTLDILILFIEYS